MGEGEEGDGRCSPKREQVNPATVVVPRTVRRGTVEATVDSLIGIAPLMTRNPLLRHAGEKIGRPKYAA